VRGTGQVRAGFCQRIPEEHVKDPVKSLVTALPPDLAFKTKGELAIRVTVGDRTVLACEDVAKKLLRGKRPWEVRSAGEGSKGQRWYAWAWTGTRSPGHSLLVRRHRSARSSRGGSHGPR
jgi:hypothetical protein